MDFAQLMDDHGLKIIIGGVVALLFGIGFYEYHTSKKRREALEKFAADNGYKFTQDYPLSTKEDAENPNPLALKGKHTKLFSQGSKKTMDYVLSRPGEDDNKFFFDYEYVTRSGKSDTTYRQSVARFVLDGKKMPEFTIEPEDIIQRVFESHYKDIDFEQHPGFSKKYFLKGKDESSVRELFNDSILNMLEKTEKLYIESNGDELFIYRNYKRVAPENMSDFIHDTTIIFEALAQRLQ